MLSVGADSWAWVGRESVLLFPHLELCHRVDGLAESGAGMVQQSISPPCPKPIALMSQVRCTVFHRPFLMTSLSPLHL